MEGDTKDSYVRGWGKGALWGSRGPPGSTALYFRTNRLVCFHVDLQSVSSWPWRGGRGGGCWSPRNLLRFISVWGRGWSYPQERKEPSVPRLWRGSPKGTEEEGKTHRACIWACFLPKPHASPSRAPLPAVAYLTTVPRLRTALHPPRPGTSQPCSHSGFARIASRVFGCIFNIHRGSLQPATLPARALRVGSVLGMTFVGFEGLSQRDFDRRPAVIRVHFWRIGSFPKNAYIHML